MIPENPAQLLLGSIVSEVWHVDEKVDLKENGSTGGNFCIPYKVRHIETGQMAFLKVLDVVKAIQTYHQTGRGDVAYTLSRITSAHVFESQLMRDCASMNRIVKALDFGQINLEVFGLGLIGFPYLIFELADGDTHKFWKASGAIDHAWWFSTLQQATLGMSQLHTKNIAHQDLKPSNVVFFGADNAKLADLGRAAKKGTESLNDDRAGDRRYWPPEFFYGYVLNEWRERYLALDLYLLGGLAFSGVAQLPLTMAVFQKLPPELHFRRFSSYQDALPALRKALADVLEETRPFVPSKLRDNFTMVVSTLCEPDPAKRGHPDNHKMKHGNKCSLERYVSIFHRMSVDAAADLKK